MLKGHDIIYCSNDWNADNRTSSHHIARMLGKYNRLVYVEASGLRPPNFSGHDLIRIFSKILKSIKGVHLVENQIYVFTPLIIPFHQYRIIRELNKFILIYSVKRICRKIGFENPILWIIIPHMNSLVGKFKEKMVIYYCVDDFSALPGVETTAVKRHDLELSKKADIIFTPSEPLYQNKKLINTNTFLSPHGVDIEHFSRVFDNRLAVPADMKKIPGPIVGFFGLIEKWIDLELVLYIARSKPEWSLVMIGRVAQDISIFQNIKNVYFLGAKKYELLPSYGKLFNVAIIPYVMNIQVFNANPIKLREYLAMGKPVVSVRTPEIEKFSSIVKISDTYENFVDNIQLAIKEDSAKEIFDRIEFVKGFSWENRFKNISETVDSYLNSKERA